VRRCPGGALLPHPPCIPAIQRLLSSFTFVKLDVKVGEQYAPLCSQRRPQWPCDLFVLRREAPKGVFHWSSPLCRGPPPTTDPQIPWCRCARESCSLKQTPMLAPPHEAWRPCLGAHPADPSLIRSNPSKPKPKTFYIRCVCPDTTRGQRRHGVHGGKEGPGQEE